MDGLTLAQPVRVGVGVHSRKSGFQPQGGGGSIELPESGGGGGGPEKGSIDRTMNQLL